MSRIRSIGWLFSFTLLLFGAGLMASQAADYKSAVPEKDRGKFYGAKKTVYPSWFKTSFLNFKDDVAEAAAAGKRIIIMFHQDGCPYCNALVERNLSQKEISDKMQKEFQSIAINMWGDRVIATVDGKTYKEKHFAEALKVQFTPTLLFLDEKGNIVLRINGYLPPERLQLALDYVAGKNETKISYRNYVAANLPPASSGDMNKQDFFSPPPFDLTRKSNTPLAVFFEQPQCPGCDRLHKEVLTDSRTRDIIKQFDTAQLDMWSDTPVTTPDGKQSTAREWAKALKVGYAPSIVLFNSEGAEIIRSEADFLVFHTQSIFDYVLSGAYKKQPSFQRYIALRAERIRDKGTDVNIWKN